MNYFFQKRMLHKVLMILVIISLVGCAGFGEKYKALTPDEKARVNINGLQDQLGAWFDAGKIFVDANPKYKEEWKTKVIPSVDLANQAIGAYIATKSNDSAAYKQILPLVSKVIATLSAWGITVK